MIKMAIPHISFQQDILVPSLAAPFLLQGYQS